MSNENSTGPLYVGRSEVLTWQHVSGPMYRVTFVGDPQPREVHVHDFTRRPERHSGGPLVIAMACMLVGLGIIAVLLWWP